jgi:peptide/nickel transport system ATP-binding protein
MSLLEIKNLEVAFPFGKEKELLALRGIDLRLNESERLGIVGESGAGKSMLAFSILKLIRPPGYIKKGSILFEKRQINEMGDKELRKIRGNKIAMIFQDPMSTLNPLLTIQTQMIETLFAHEKISEKQARQKAYDALEQVAIPSPELRLKCYPHELSGGMKQRVVIAIAMLTNPQIIIADEPTTALDVTIQAEIMALLKELCKKQKLALILITHDLAVVSQIATQIAVMYAGKIIEYGKSSDIINNPKHPYTQDLLAALPQQNKTGQRLKQIAGKIPSLESIPVGCAFHPRCRFVEDICKKQTPIFDKVGARSISCFLAQKTT